MKSDSSISLNTDFIIQIELKYYFRIQTELGFNKLNIRMLFKSLEINR